MASLLTQIKVRKDTYANIKDLVLTQGEPGFAHDTGDYAVGDGTNKFSDICFSLKEGVTSNGTSTDNAIARFDGATGKIIQTSGATIDDNLNLKFNGPGNISWEDGSYFQRIQVTDDSTQNTAVFTFQQTENSGTAWNDLFTIQDRGTIIAKNSTGGALSLTLDRGSNANWRWLSDNGNFIAQCDYTTAKGSYFNVLTMNYNTGHISVDRGSLTSKGGFIHGGLTAATGKTKDDYVLLAGGGSKAISEFTGTTYGADRGISLSGGKFGHSNTAVTAVTTAGLYKIKYDAYGHITGTESFSLPTVNNGKLTMAVSGTGLLLGSTKTFTANQSSNATITYTLDSNAEGNRTANQVVIAKADGRINSEQLAITSSGAEKVTMQYDTSYRALKFVFA